MRELLNLKNVVAVYSGTKLIGGIDTGKKALVVGVSHKEPLSNLSKKDIVPAKYHGLMTDVQETGEIIALRTDKHRPMPGGVSIGHPQVTAGTGTPVRIQPERHMIIMSNNHVMANSNDAEIDDATLQPGTHDGGTIEDTIGHLAEFVPIHFTDEESGCKIALFIVRVLNFLSGFFGRKTRLFPYANYVNKVDAALSIPISQDDVVPYILDIGNPTGFCDAIVGEPVKKSGRTSGLTHGTVTATDGAAKVSYGGKYAIFEDQIITTNIASPGDSGSLVLDADDCIVGMLFAGSDKLTIVNKIDNVLRELGLD